MPTMVWIYGGNFVAGDGGDGVTANTYDGCEMAAQHGVVMVTLNCE